MRLRWDKGSFYIGDKPFILLSGEIHYYRIKRENWPDRVKKLKMAGLNSVAFYIPWDWHEPEEGCFDFWGKTCPEKDLVGWMEMIKDAGLHAIPRPCVYNYGEWVPIYPDWVLRNYPNSRACSSKVDTNLGIINPLSEKSSYLDPDFIACIKKWYGQVAEIVVPFLSTHGGNVILIQPCNEIGGALQIDFRDFIFEMYRNWLKEEYSSIEELNSIHRSNYESFRRVEVPNSSPDRIEILRRWYDWDRFRYKYWSIYAGTLINIFQNKGIDIPFVFNNPGEPHFHYNIVKDHKAVSFTGYDYYGPHPRSGSFHVTSLPKVTFDLAVLEALIDRSSPLTMPETGAGWATDLPWIDPGDLDLYYYWVLAHNVRGFFFYLFAGGINPDKHGGVGKTHDWQSPVGMDGSIRPHYQTLKEFAELLKNNPVLQRARMIPDISFGYYPSYFSYYPLFHRSFPSDALKKLGMSTDMKSAILDILYDSIILNMILSGLSFNAVDLSKATLDGISKNKQLWVFSLDFMDEKVQTMLLEYARAGGTLILTPVVPYYNFRFDKCDIFQNELSFKQTLRLDRDQFYVEALGIERLHCRSPYCSYSVEEAEHIFRIDDDGTTVGFVKKYGRGRIIVIGFAIPDRTGLIEAHQDFYRRIFEFSGTDMVVSCSNRKTLARLSASDNEIFLIAFNFRTIEQRSSFNINIDGKQIRYPKQGEISLKPRKAVTLTIG